MKLMYRKYQDNSSNEAKNGKWYARTVINETVEIEQLATKMQDNCTVKRADILAVLSELGPTMRDLLQDSKRVRIPYLGAFKLGISTIGAESEEKFTAKNVKNVHVVFQPATHTLADGSRVKDFVAECRVMEVPKSSTATTAADSTTGGSGTSGTGGNSDDPIDQRP